MSQSTISATFDLSLYGHALEHHDSTAQLACYAEDAEISVVLRDQREDPTHRISGRDDVSAWLTTWSMEYAQIRIVKAIEGPERVIIAECRRADGTFAVYASTVKVRDGLITDQYVVLLEDAGVKVAPLRDGGRLLLPVFSV